MIYSQSEFDLRCEWGLQGVEHLAPISDAVIIVDIFSFTTSVEIATARGAVLYPYRGTDASLWEFAVSLSAELAYRDSQYSLSPSSLESIPPETRLVMPSPNGSTLSMATGQVATLAGCLRNARAVAMAAQRFGQRIAVIPAGERWADGSLRPALEDWLGAGAILSHFEAGLSPEARAAVAAFQVARRDLLAYLEQCSSGREKRSRGQARDIELAAALDVSENTPILVEGAYRRNQLGDQ